MEATKRFAVSLVSAILPLAPLSGLAASWTLENITQRDYRDEVFRLPVPVPDGNVQAFEDGTEVPVTVDVVEGKRVAYVRTTIAVAGTHAYELRPGKPSEFPAVVTVTKERDTILLENDRFAMRVPLSVANAAPCPVSALRLGDQWVGGGEWRTGLPPKGLTTTVIDDGRVMGKVRLRYEFDALAGINGDVPAYAEVDVTVMPNQPFAVIEERHEMDRLSAWEFTVTRGWKADRSIIKTHSGGGFGNTQRVAENKGSLRFRQVNNTDPALLINLFPRWNQHCKDGWLGAAAGSDGAVGALVILAGYWYWPHDNSIRCLVAESGDTMTLRCPTQRGMRYWWLMAGAEDLFNGAQGLATRYGLESLDTIVNSIPIRDWPGQPGRYSGYWPLSSNINPTGGVRGWGKGTIGGADRSINSPAHLVQAQWLNSPHVYGSYWLYWSPENPNFFTDFNKVPIGMLANLKNHPRFKELAAMGVQKFREDMYHSITMPSGAGNECPGYQQYAMKHYLAIAEVCRDQFGVDATKWPRFKAGASFAIHLSQPIGNGKRGSHPGGDTHAGYRYEDPRDFAHKFGVEEDVTTFKSEELQGFGAVLRNRCGTAAETYFAFKSGPSRGHFHGDQLSFHLAANAHRIAVDYGCSYGPRGAQEHLHNRLCFFTDEIPYANMDGYERLIGFKTSDIVDAAMGQVESWRLRGVNGSGSEDWHDEWPLTWFEGKPLTYRRTVVLLKGEPDMFVIRDQYESPVELGVAYPLHVFDNDTVTRAHKGTATTLAGTELTDSNSDFTALGIRPGCVVVLGVSHGMNNCYAVKAVKGNALVLDHDVGGDAAKTDYMVLSPYYEQSGPLVNFKSMSVYRAHPADATVRFFPWFHGNGGLEATQAIRMESRGTSGAFVTVLIPRRLAKGTVAQLTFRESLIARAVKAPKDAAGESRDLSATLTWIDGKLKGEDLLLDAPTFNKASHRGTVTGEGQPTDFTFVMDLTIGSDKWIKGGAAKLAGAFKVKAGKVDGTYEGTFEGEPVKGVVEGTLVENTWPPVPIYAERSLPDLSSIPGGVKIGDTEVVFAGGIDDEASTTYVRVTRVGDVLFAMSGDDVDLDRSQGEVGLFVPDAGYPFGEIPNWLVRQRLNVPDWAPDWAKQIRGRRQ